MFDFYELENMLEDASVGSRAAECHGFLCAQVCVSGAVHEEIFTEYLFAEATDDAQIDECFRQIQELVMDIARQMSSSDFEFELLLPGDDHSLEQRGIALREWCQGFLSGLGVAGLGSTETMSDASKELIDDLYEICRLSTDELDEEGEEGESSLVELIEYVRMGAMFIYDELRGLPSGAGNSEMLH